MEGKHTRKTKQSSRQQITFMVIVIVAVTGFPYLQKGLCGYFPDLMYHMLRIEAVKDALQEGIFPVRIYDNFFNGYGYGSPLFYPDIFLLLPALLRIASIPPLAVWKIFALCLTAVASLTSYFSIHYICRDREFSIAATFMLMLSQFYLADLCHRVGLSEYLAFIFIPVLIAGIYDFFVREGRKTWLMGIAFGGLLLSHTIMTVIGVLLTALIFIRMIFVRRENCFLFDKKRMQRLIVTAIGVFLCTAYFTFPMLEQMASGTFQYMTPWAKVGDYVQPLSTFFRVTGYFSHIAYVGIGIPVLILFVVCLFLKRPENKWAFFFLIGGCGMFLLTTSLFPWAKLNDTILNMIQFPYRFYPYALLFVIIGITMILVKNFSPGVKGRTTVLLIIISSSVLCGIVQNVTIKSSEESKQIDAAYLEGNTGYVGAGEWLPQGVDADVAGLTATVTIKADGEITDQELRHEGRYYYFTTEKDADSYILPLMYYKGYEARICCEDGSSVLLMLDQSENALVRVSNMEEKEGEIRIVYAGTIVQKISCFISLGAVLFILLYMVRKHKKADGNEENHAKENESNRRK